jgi:hypothetical protein
MEQLNKARVVAVFRDRETSVVYSVGDEFEGSAERVDELTSGGYLAPIEKKPKAAPKKER